MSWPFGANNGHHSDYSFWDNHSSSQSEPLKINMFLNANYETKNPCGSLRAGSNRSILPFSPVVRQQIESSHALEKSIIIWRLPGITNFPLASIILVPPGIIKFLPTCLIIRKKKMQSHVYDFKCCYIITIIGWILFYYYL